MKYYTLDACKTNHISCGQKTMLVIEDSHITGFSVGTFCREPEKRESQDCTCCITLDEYWISPEGTT